jgi:hypothetical protein
MFVPTAFYIYTPGAWKAQQFRPLEFLAERKVANPEAAYQAWEAGKVVAYRAHNSWRRLRPVRAWQEVEP